MVCRKGWDVTMSEVQAVMVFGAGISGRGAAMELAALGKQVFLYDDTPRNLDFEFIELLVQNGGGFVFGRGEFLLDRIQQIILSPAIPMDTPLVKKAQEKGIEVIAEIELAFRNYAGHMVAITGTNGKTTTTTLVGEMLKTLPVKTAVGGNIGRALSAEIKDLDKDSWVAAEVSSYQLEGIQSFRPQIAAVLNLTPDHLTRHKTMEEYGRCKQNIFINQQGQDVTILNYDDPEVRTWGKKSRGQLCYFSRNTVLPQGVYMKDGSFILQWGNTKAEICHKDELQIFGAHNEENVLAAIACGFFAGVGPEQMRQVLLDFKGVAHRIEYVATIDGVSYYNDSKATNTDAVIKALNAFSQGHVILLAGGEDKMTPLAEMMQVVREKADLLILLGASQQRFHEAAKAAGIENILLAGSFREAVEMAHARAKAPQVVLLSPACASFDMFRNMAERGNYFKELVKGFAK